MLFQQNKWTFVLTECDHFYVTLRRVFEGIFFTEKDITIETDELEEEEIENSVKNEEQQHRRSKRGFAGICWKSPKVEQKD